MSFPEIENVRPTPVGSRAAVLGIVAVLPLVCIATVSAQAQQVAPSRVTPESLRPAAPAPPIIELPGAAGPTAPANAANLSVQVGDIVVDGTFPEFRAETAALLDPLRRKRLTVAQIYAAATALEHAYAAAGFILARVVVPRQKLVDGGALHLTVIDGFIERIDVNAVPAHVRASVAARMAALVGVRHVTLADIERRLLVTADLPGLQLRSTIAAGATPGGTLLVLDATQNYVSGSVGVDDRLPRSLGIWSFNSTLALNNTLGFGEQFYVSGSTSTDFGNPPLQVFGGGIVMPIGNDGFTLNPEYTRSLAEPFPAPGTPPGVGEFQRAALHANYSIIHTRAQTLSVQATLEWDDEFLRPVGFAQQIYRDTYTTARLQATDAFSLPWGEPVSLSGTFSQGLTGRDATAVLPLSQQGASPLFSKANLQASISQGLPTGAIITLIGRAQSSFGQPLMLAEQFSLDGSDAMSAFASGTFSVDQGATLRAELSRPVWIEIPAPESPLRLSPYLFGAAGLGVIFLPTAVEQKDINAASAGLGVRTDIGNPQSPVGGAVALELARQFSDVPADNHGYRINLSLNLRF